MISDKKGVRGLNQFTSADTLIPQPGDSQAWDRYSYVLNNPLKYIDPSGHGAYSGDDDYDPGYRNMPTDSIYKGSDIKDNIENNPIEFENGVFSGEYTHATVEHGTLNQIQEAITNGDIVMMLLIWEDILDFGHWVLPIDINYENTNSLLKSYLDPGFEIGEKKSFVSTTGNSIPSAMQHTIDGYNRKRIWAPGLTNTHVVLHRNITGFNLKKFHQIVTNGSLGFPKVD